MCNKHCRVITLNNNSKEASNFTQKLYNKISKDTNYMSYTKELPSTQKGKLVDASDFEIKNIFSLKPYVFLNDDSNNKKTVHPALWEHAKLNMNVGLFRINNIEKYNKHDNDSRYSEGKFMANIGDVFQVRGYDLANMTLVRGESGWIIMDVLTCNETAKAAFDFATSYVDCESHKISAVFYSHSHIDHYGGIAGIVDEKDVRTANESKNLGKIEIIAPKGFMHYAVSENIYAGNAMGSRAVFMYGAVLMRGAQGQVDNGLGKATAIGTTSLIAPSEEIGFDDLEPEKRYVSRIIDGIEFQFQITPGTEAPAEMNVYMPETEVLFIAENCTGTLHNLYTLRGAEVRDGMAWADYLDETITIFPNSEIICSSHNWPRFGKQQCLEYLSLQRDVYRYMTNTTLNLINKGYTIDEVGRMLEENIPDAIRNEWCNHGFYGTFNHNAKAIYQKYLGWYDGNPANLNKMLPTDSATRYVECMGGATKVIKMAQEAYTKGEYAWVAELLNKVIFAKLNCLEETALKKAYLLCADALEQMGYQAESGPWRNEYLTAAGILRGKINLPTDIPSRVSDTTVSAMSIEMIMKYFGIMLNGFKAAAQNYKLNIYVSLDGLHDSSESKGECKINCVNGIISRFPVNTSIQHNQGNAEVQPDACCGKYGKQQVIMACCFLLPDYIKRVNFGSLRAEPSRL